MLSETSKPIIAATLPVVGENLSAIVDVFYDSMLGENPQLLNLFNRSAQASGEQRRSLAGSVALYAATLVGQGLGVDVMDQMIERVAHRHAALGIHPEQYAIVGKYLLGAVVTVLGEAVTPEVGAAWHEVYGLFEARLVSREARLYAEAGVSADDPWRAYRVAGKVAEAADTVSLLLKPVDGRGVPEFRAGQYVSVTVELPGGGQQIRQYSLSRAGETDHLRITVKRVRGRNGAPDGVVSTLLHDAVQVNDVLRVSQPYGDLALADGESPIVLVSAGIGITPMVAMLDHVATAQPGRAVTVVHADRSPSSHALQADVADNAVRLEEFESLLWYEDPADADAREGFVDPDAIPVPDGADVYLCGPVAFMTSVRENLEGRGVPSERIKWEVFGSQQYRAA